MPTSSYGSIAVRPPLAALGSLCPLSLWELTSDNDQENSDGSRRGTFSESVEVVAEGEGSAQSVHRSDKQLGFGVVSGEWHRFVIGTGAAAEETNTINIVDYEEDSSTLTLTAAFPHNTPISSLAAFEIDRTWLYSGSKRAELQWIRSGTVMVNHKKIATDTDSLSSYAKISNLATDYPTDPYNPNTVFLSVGALTVSPRVQLCRAFTTRVPPPGLRLSRSRETTNKQFESGSRRDGAELKLLGSTNSSSGTFRYSNRIQIDPFHSPLVRTSNGSDVGESSHFAVTPRGFSSHENGTEAAVATSNTSGEGITAMVFDADGAAVVHLSPERGSEIALESVPRPHQAITQPAEKRIHLTDLMTER
eukprot:GHVN01064404.1.p1 GENE.GHVN01064404.1~~GHVN01064404.1.p1  ORF type:complete len:363 (-),score=19.27 GHVN01064404.1:837-1925(-)